MSATAIDSFQSRVKNAINGKYRPIMHRSVQSLVLYEADRCLKDRYSCLKPFQQKFALLATASDLLETFDFLDDAARQEIMNAGKDALKPVQAWRRMKSITKELDGNFLPKAKVLLEDEGNQGKSHDEICEMLLQRSYEESSETTKPRRPPMWEYNHLHMFVVYRVYYRGLALNSDLPAATPPKVVDVPDKKPAGFRKAPFTATLSKMTLAPGKKGKNNANMSDEQRKMFKELKLRIDEFLATFEGEIPEDELNKRKRVLYAKLRLGRLAGGAKNKKQKQQERKKNAQDTGVVTEPPTTDEDCENVGPNETKKQERKAMREARRGEAVKPETVDAEAKKQQRKANREARRGAAKKQQKVKEEQEENNLTVAGEEAVINSPTTDEDWGKKWAKLERAKKQQRKANREARRGGAKKQ